MAPPTQDYLRYVPIDEETPSTKGDYLCRLLDNRKRPFYLVLTWYGRSFWRDSTMAGPHKNVTHWAAIPICKDDLNSTHKGPDRA